MSDLLEAQIPTRLQNVDPNNDQRSIPLIAKDLDLIKNIRNSILDLDTTHEVVLGDARNVKISSKPIHLVVTSPPYWTLKDYPNCEGQIGRLDDYKYFLAGLNQVWRKCFKALVPGGRLICVVGDVCLSRRQNRGRHTVIPLHADIINQCVTIGFDNLSPIIWHKITNLQTESTGNSSYLGKPFEPNGVLKNEIEYILMFRKPGGYRSPSRAARLMSVISHVEHNAWFRQIWNDIQGASTKEHPAPFPVEIAKRLIRMFSFVDDIVLDPFTGTASTQVAAKQCGRNSIGIEIEPSYHAIATTRLESDLFTGRS
ncbi:MAG: site-specific DNA-methyltransferase [Gammaproteobacteria bacterium]|nr:site-specific DNA-methyltransferase [Gammaproteobacteria bacterium]